MNQTILFTKTAADALRTKARQTATEAARQGLSLAEVMYETKYATVQVGNAPIELWKLWGFTSWELYVETELEYHMGTAAKYVRVWEVFFVKFKGKWDKPLLPKSITKLKDISRVATTSTCNAWFRRASRMTCCELHDSVEAALHGGKGRKMRVFATPVTANGLDTLNHAITKAREDFGVLDRGEALVHIAREWDLLRTKAKKLRAA